MPRVRKGAARRQSKKRIFKEIRGFRGPRGKNWRLAKESWMRAQVAATADRKAKKRQFRGLWITRLSAACTQRGLRYSRLIYGLKLAQIAINRKMLSELAVNDPEAFDAVMEIAKKAQEEVA